MIRTQILITAEQYVYLLERKRLTGETLSSIIRRAVEIQRRQSVQDAGPKGNSDCLSIPWTA